MADTSNVTLYAGVIALAGTAGTVIGSIINSKRQSKSTTDSALITTASAQAIAEATAQKNLEGLTIGHLFKELERLTGEVKEAHKSVLELQTRVSILEQDKIDLRADCAAEKEKVKERDATVSTQNKLIASLQSTVQKLADFIAVQDWTFTKEDKIIIGDIEVSRNKQKSIDNRLAERFGDIENCKEDEQ